jgi:hypothetical protein
MKKNISFTLILGLLGLLASCASKPAAKAPDWVYNTPSEDGTYTYFVGFSEDRSEAQALDGATASIVAEIVRYMGVKVSAESTMTARSDLESLERSLEETVKQTSNARMAGFQLADRYVSRAKDGAVTVFILGKYATKDLEAEKNRIAAVFQEQLDAVSLPEGEGRSLLAQGDVIGATKKFIEAAAAAFGADIDNAEIKFERNINLAKNALGKLTIVKLNDNLQTAPGESFAEAFRARVESDGRQQAHVPVVVSYQYKMPNGRMGTRRVELLSDASGLLVFEHPKPDFVGKASLMMRLDLSSATEPLFRAPPKLQSLIAGLEDEIAGKRAQFDYQVLSGARTVPTAVFVVDLDAANRATSSTSNSALQQALSSNGFNLIPITMDVQTLLSGNDVSIPKAAKTLLGNRAKRLVWGISRVVKIADDTTVGGAQKIATVSAEIKVADLESGQILYTVIKQAIAMGGSEAQAIEAARQQLAGKTIGSDLSSSLP